MDESARVLSAVRRALLGMSGDLSLNAVLQELVDAALDLAGARYAALGIPDGDGGFAQFITAGMDDDLIDRLGPLPRTHGMLGAMLEEPAPFRTADIRQDPRFTGWWPAAHPDMRSFLGYPMVFKGDIVGAFYLTDKIAPSGGVAEEAPQFSERDEWLVGEFAAQGAVLIELARLYGASRELSVADERARIARELHDSLTQNLFGIRLALRTATVTLETARGAAEPEAPPATTTAVEQLERGAALLDSAFDQLRALVWDLQPPDLGTDPLVAVISKQLALLERTSGLRVELSAVPEADSLEPDQEHQLLRIIQEAMTNVARHADASLLTVSFTLGEPAAGAPRLRVEIRDDGVGFDPERRAIRGRRLGLTSMRERAQALDGLLTLATAPGKGTTVTVEVPLD